MTYEEMLKEGEEYVMMPSLTHVDLLEEAIWDMHQGDSHIRKHLVQAYAAGYSEAELKWEERTAKHDTLS